MCETGLGGISKDSLDCRGGCGAWKWVRVERRDGLYHGSSSPNFRGDLKISDQNNWGDLSKKLNLGELNFRGGPMNPNDIMVHSVHSGINPPQHPLFLARAPLKLANCPRPPF